MAVGVIPIYYSAKAKGRRDSESSWDRGHSYSYTGKKLMTEFHTRSPGGQRRGRYFQSVGGIFSEGTFSKEEYEPSTTDL